MTRDMNTPGKQVVDGQAVAQAAGWLRSARKAIAFTGAGASTESGIPDFRGGDGLWRRFPPAEYATLGAFMANPGKVWRMLAELEELLEAQPNMGHEALAQLEAMGLLAGVITQNIDGLHQRAGSRTVVEFHGSSQSFTCMRCQARYDAGAVRGMPRAGDAPMPMPTDCHNGGTGCMLKPDVVLFDEGIPQEAMHQTAQLLEGADLVLVAGTSCEVYPAAGIPTTVRANGGRIVEINLEPVPHLGADLVLQGSFGGVLAALAATLQDGLVEK